MPATDYPRSGPPQVSQTPGASDALALVEDAYPTRLRRSGRTAEHPIAVAELLLGVGEPATVVLTGLLHDVLEDTGVTAAQLRK